jgi:hypothetical protein
MPDEDKMASELAILQKEWRKSISDTLHELRQQNNAIQTTLVEMKEEFVREAEFNSLKKKVESLESDKAKVIGAMIVLQALGTAAIWLAGKLIVNAGK